MMQIIHLLFFQLIWWTLFLSMWSAASFIGSCLSFVLLLIYLNFLHFSKSMVRKVIIITFIGVVGETFLAVYEIITYHQPLPYIGTCLWVLFAWLNFAIASMTSLKVFQNRHLLNSILGGGFGYLTYSYAAEIGVIFPLVDAFQQLGISLFWGLMFPICMHISSFDFK